MGETSGSELDDDTRERLWRISNAIGAECDAIIKSGEGDLAITRFWWTMMASIGASIGVTAKMSNFDDEEKRLLLLRMLDGFETGFYGGVEGAPQVEAQH
jgi:hypothetical protein